MAKMKSEFLKGVICSIIIVLSHYKVECAIRTVQLFSKNGFNIKGIDWSTLAKNSSQIKKAVLQNKYKVEDEVRIPDVKDGELPRRYFFQILVSIIGAFNPLGRTLEISNHAGKVGSCLSHMRFWSKPCKMYVKLSQFLSVSSYIQSGAGNDMMFWAYYNAAGGSTLAQRGAPNTQPYFRRSPLPWHGLPMSRNINQDNVMVLGDWSSLSKGPRRRKVRLLLFIPSPRKNGSIPKVLF